MKILAFSHTGLTTGGAEQCLIEYVSALSSRGHQCRVIMPQDGPMRKVFDEKNIETGIIGYGWAIRPHKNFNRHEITTSTGNSLVSIFEEVDRYKPDVILVNTAVIPWGLYAGRSLGVPTVLLVHEILNEKDPSLDVLPNYREYTEILNNNVDLVLYNSQFVKSQFEDYITKPKISKKILYPLPPLSVKRINKIMKPNKIAGDKIQIAIFGALAPRKNQLEAVESAAKLVSMGVKNFHMDFYGDKAANLPYVTELKKMIANNSLESYVTLKGYSNSVYETMVDYNIIVSTSTYEPFGRTIIEGQLLGRVVIANNTGGGVELIEDGKTGLIYNLGDPDDLAKKIVWILKNKKNALHIASQSQKTQIEKFPFDTRYDALFEGVEYFKENSRDIVFENDIFNPITAMYKYHKQQFQRYDRLYRIFNNRLSRNMISIARSAKTKGKRIVKEFLAR